MSQYDFRCRCTNQPGTLSLTGSHHPSNCLGYLCLLEDRPDRNWQVILVRDSRHPVDCVHTLPTPIVSSNAISGTCVEAHGRDLPLPQASSATLHDESTGRTGRLMPSIPGYKAGNGPRELVFPLTLAGNHR